MNTINYGRQTVDESDIKAVLDTLTSDYLTQGPQVSLFEQSITKTCSSQHAIAFNSATSALHCACLALDLKPGDTLWTTPITFVASANCARYCGAEVDFVDIDPDTYNLCPSALLKKIQEAEKKGALPKIIVVVHLCGQPCDMKKISKIATAYNIKVIEDASHALGARYQNHPIGDCKYSDITIFSFHPVKIITSAEGGMATTNQIELAKKMRLAASHGITRSSEEMIGKHEEPWFYEQISLGYNYRMSDIHAALGNSQLKRLSSFINERQRIADTYNTELSTLPIKLPLIEPDCLSAYHLYVIRVDKQTRMALYEHLKNNGVLTNVHYIPVHLQPYYKKLGFKKGDYPNAEKYYEEALTLPIYPSLTKEQLNTVIQLIKQVL